MTPAGKETGEAVANGVAVEVGGVPMAVADGIEVAVGASGDEEESGRGQADERVLVHDLKRVLAFEQREGAA